MQQKSHVKIGHRAFVCDCVSARDGWGHPKRGVPAHAANRGGSPMSGYDSTYMKGAPRAIDLVDEAPQDLLPRCPVEGCDAMKTTSFREAEDGASIRVETCKDGHFISEREVSVPWTAVQAIYGP